MAVMPVTGHMSVCLSIYFTDPPCLSMHKFFVHAIPLKHLKSGVLVHGQIIAFFPFFRVISTQAEA